MEISAINRFLRNSWERGWRSVLCFLSSLLIPHSSGQREGCLHIHSPCGNGAIAPPVLFRPLSTRSCRAWLILCLVMVGRLQSFFQSPLLARLQSYRDTGSWEGGRENEVHREQSLRGVHLSFFMCHSWGDLRERPRWLERRPLKISWWWFVQSFWVYMWIGFVLFCQKLHNVRVHTHTHTHETIDDCEWHETETWSMTQG